MEFRPAAAADLDLLARMNKALIADEGHSNPMSVDQLRERMQAFLEADYAATLFEEAGQAIGYALFRAEDFEIHLRQFFVDPAFRRAGRGREALDWLFAHPWRGARRVTLDVLSGNAAGLGFWRAMGFSDYALRLERRASA